MIKNTDYLDLLSEKRVTEVGLLGVILLFSLMSGDGFTMLFGCILVTFYSFDLSRKNKKLRQRLQE